MRGSRHIPGGTARRAKGPASAVDPSSSKSSEASRGKKPTKSKIVFTEGESLSQESLIAFMESLSQKTDGSRGKRTGGVLRTICVENRQRVAVEKKPATPAPEVPLAPIAIKNSQRGFAIDMARVQEDLDILRSILKVRDFSVDVWFCSDEKIQTLNEDYRGKSKPTDILSFPITDFSPPEVLAERLEFDAEKLLGDMIISPAYVYRQCLADYALLHPNGPPLPLPRPANAVRAAEASEGVKPDEDRGVSREMATVFTLEERLPLLLIHGLLHLLGHDHETPSEWQRMTQREDEVLAEYRRIRAQQRRESEPSSSSV
eukprot:gene2164-1579_t